MYTVTAQYSHHTTDQKERLGDMDLAMALEAFDKFDWIGEAERADQLKKASPTLAFEDKAKGKLLWVSAYAPRGSLLFVSECSFPGKVPKLFGLWKSQGTVELSTGDLTIAQARKAIELFYAGASRELRKLYSPYITGLDG
ncbi:MAG: hypothetical protein ACRDG4_14735 [Chloroflexota bacterium]